MFDARQLHAWLGSGERFTTWIKDRIKQYQFVEGLDFFGLSRKTGGRPRQDYLITIDMAKELAMIERTERGRETRRYFIQMEKAAREMATTLAQQGQPEEIPQAFKEALADMERRMVALVGSATSYLSCRRSWITAGIRLRR